MGIKWEQKPTSLPVARYGRNLEKQVKREATKVVLQMEGYAKINRPWEDDTGAARAGLRGFIEEQANAILLVIAHSVDYGIYLELAGGGRFKALLALVRANPVALETTRAGTWAILWPTVQHHIPILKQRLQSLGLRWDR